MLPRAMKGGMAGKQEGIGGPPMGLFFCHVEMVAHIRYFLVSKFLFRSSFSGR